MSYTELTWLKEQLSPYIGYNLYSYNITNITIKKLSGTSFEVGVDYSKLSPDFISLVDKIYILAGKDIIPKGLSYSVCDPQNVSDSKKFTITINLESDNTYKLRVAFLLITKDIILDPNVKTLDTLIQPTIYGFKIDKNNSDPATRVSYTDDATGFTPMTVNQSTGAYSLNSWDNTFIVEAFRPVMLKYDGTVDYELNHDDQTKKLDGTASDISNTSYGGNAMVEVSKMWFKRWEDANYEYCQVSNKKIDSSFHCYAHMRDANTELDHIYLPMFKGSDVSSKLRSIAGQAPISSSDGATEVQYAQANGTNWYINDWSNYKMIEDLLILLGRNTDSQTTFGSGHCLEESAADVLTTGTLKSKGMFYGTSGNAVKVFWLENWYGDRWDRCAGCLNVNGTIKVKPYKPYNETGTDYISTGVTPSGGNIGYQSAHKMTEYGLVPKTASGSDSTYIPDGLWYNNSGTKYALFGGSCLDYIEAGSSSLSLSDDFSYWRLGIGASPSYK